MPQNKKIKKVTAKQSGLLVQTSSKVLLCILTGLVVSIISVIVVWQQYSESLIRRAENISTLLDSRYITDVQETDGKSQEEMSALRRQLQKIHAVNSDANVIFIVDMDRNTEVSYVANSEPSTSQRFVPYGTDFLGASSEMKALFFSGNTYIEDPIHYANTSSVTSFAPIQDESARRVAVLGLQIGPGTYLAVIGLAAAIPMIAALLVALLFVLADSIRKRRQEHLMLRGELISIASHELRTPLTGLRWAEESLLKQKLAPKPREITENMHTSTTRLQESIEDILQLAHWQSGRKKSAGKTSVDMKKVIEDIFATSRLSASQRGISLELTGDWQSEPIINCDAGRMKRVFHNLISNAIKYAHANTSVEVGYELVDKAHLITITDHGIGIPQSEQEKVITGSYRASNAVSEKIDGNGMGLYLSKEAVLQEGGKLWFRSTEGKGTTVYVQLP